MSILIHSSYGPSDEIFTPITGYPSFLAQFWELTRETMFARTPQPRGTRILSQKQSHGVTTVTSSCIENKCAGIVPKTELTRSGTKLAKLARTPSTMFLMLIWCREWAMARYGVGRNLPVYFVYYGMPSTLSGGVLQRVLHHSNNETAAGWEATRAFFEAVRWPLVWPCSPPGLRHHSEPATWTPSDQLMISGSFTS